MEVDLWIEYEKNSSKEIWGRSAVPSGASTGTYEAVELRDGSAPLATDADKKRYGGKGVLKAVSNVNEIISREIEGKEFDQKSLDEALVKLDGTKNKERLGSNAILGVSLAFARTAAGAEEKTLWKYFMEISNTKEAKMPIPMMNILNGGAHAVGSADLQEFMIVPRGAKNFKEALRYGAEVFQALKKILSEKGLGTTVGDEGGFAPKLGSNEAALEIVMEAINKTGFRAGEDVAIAIDVAATELYDTETKKYKLSIENKNLSGDEMIDLYENWIKKYPIISIEDGLAEDDWESWKMMTAKLSNKLQIVGDDLFVTNIERLKRGIDQKVGNSILIKLNQIGTVSETISVVQMAREAQFNSIISHRSGETEDSTIADFAVGLGTGQIKTGSLCRSERTAKYNQLLRIEEELGPEAMFGA